MMVMARLFPRHCFYRSLDIRILIDGGCFLVSAKSVLFALDVDQFFPIAIPLIFSAKTFAKIIMHLPALCVNFLHS
jgi:hypothetical protein